jgi:serine/threonine protein kinase
MHESLLAYTLEAFRHATIYHGLGNYRLAGKGSQFLAFQAERHDGEMVCLKVSCRVGNSVHLLREKECLDICSSHTPRLLVDETANGYLLEEFIDGVLFNQKQRKILLRHMPEIICGLSAFLDDFHGAVPCRIHRDLKPAHLRLSGTRLVALDFGSSGVEYSRQIHAGIASSRKLGTGLHVHQPPEQLMSLSSRDRRVDVFSAASIIFATLYGSPPYDNAVSGVAESMAHYARLDQKVRHTLEQADLTFGDALYSALRVDRNLRSKNLHAVVSAL